MTARPDRRLVVASLVAAGLGSGAARADPLVAGTTAGQVRGRREDGVLAFKGVRYGADTAEARFQPPRPPGRWTGVLDAAGFGHASPQRSDEPDQSEDCLFLNVWTPALRDGARRPVMVYIHGGAYANGSGSNAMYDGARLVRRGDVVVVTLNHRLNAFGYLYLARLAPGFADSGNAGMLDLVLALRWVRDNIAEFGGDPGCVMLFGQSGGGAKIAALMAMPAAAGLFHRAATMSGQQVTASGPLNATRRAEVFLDALKLRPEQAAEAARRPAADLVAALKAVDPIIGSGGVYMGPVVDQRTLDRHPFYPDAPPLSARIPMMIGNTHDETRSLIGAADPSAFNLTWDDLPGRLAAAMRADIAPETVIGEYRRLYPAYSPSDVFFAATTAGRSWRGAVIEAEARAAQGSPAFAYQVDLVGAKDGGKFRAPHTIDIALVFGTLGAPGDYAGDSEASRAVSRQMQDAFIAFARTGDPNCAAIPRWERYDLSRRQTMIFDGRPRLEDDPRGAERRLFAQVPFIQQGT